MHLALATRALALLLLHELVAPLVQRGALRVLHQRHPIEEKVKEVERAVTLEHQARATRQQHRRPAYRRGGRKNIYEGTLDFAAGQELFADWLYL